MAKSVEEGSSREEDHAWCQRFKGFGNAAGNSVRHLDADMVLLAVAENPGSGKAYENSGNDAVAASPGLRDDVANGLTAFCDKGRW